MHPDLAQSLRNLRKFLDGIPDEEPEFAELTESDAQKRCAWLVANNRGFRIQDKDWEHIFTDIEEHKEAFGHYYPLMRIDLSSDNIIHMCTALMINDALYSYSRILVNQPEAE